MESPDCWFRFRRKDITKAKLVSQAGGLVTKVQQSIVWAGFLKRFSMHHTSYGSKNQVPFPTDIKHTKCELLKNGVKNQFPQMVNL